MRSELFRCSWNACNVPTGNKSLFLSGGEKVHHFEIHLFQNESAPLSEAVYSTLIIFNIRRLNDAFSFNLKEV